MQAIEQQQLTIAIENQPGRLAAIVVAAHGDINIQDISVIDTTPPDTSSDYKGGW